MSRIGAFDDLLQEVSVCERVIAVHCARWPEWFLLFKQFTHCLIGSYIFCNEST